MYQHHHLSHIVDVVYLAISSSRGQKCPAICVAQNLYLIYKAQTLVHVLSHKNPLHIFLSWYSRYILKLYSYLVLYFASFVICSGFPLNTMYSR